MLEHFGCNFKKISAVCLTLFILSSYSNANEFVLVVNKNSSIDQLTTKQIKRIFLGKMSRLSDGVRAVPLDMGMGSDIRRKFYLKMIRKSQSQLNAYWARLVFTGKAKPPEEVTNRNEMLDMVGRVNGYIGYVAVGELSDNVKIVKVINEGGDI